MRLTVGKGIDEYLSALGNLEYTAEDTVKKAIFRGAEVVADKIKENIRAMPTDDRAGKLEMRTGIMSVQKKGLENSFGIAKLQNDMGLFNVKLGFDGYNKLGQPNAMIARTFEGGNSFTRKTPFVAPAVRTMRSVAEQEMQKVVETEISKIYS